MANQTRRNWMITISHAAAGASLAEHLTSGDQLPPGVYLPSTDHLGHALMSADRFHPIPPGCTTDYVRPRIGTFEPEFFTADEFKIVCRLVELLLGEASPDLAREVSEWIDLQVASAEGIRSAELRLQPLHRSLAAAYYGAAEKTDADPAGLCRSGLAWLPPDFLSRDNQSQIALLDTISDQRADAQLENPGTRLFAFLKVESIRGFYTSSAGLKEINYKGNAYYTRSPGCETKTNL